MAAYYMEGEYANFPQLRRLKPFLIGHPGIIAGGCFKSIFCGDEVHDVDMFFRSPDDYRDAVKYFTDHPDKYVKGYENKNVESFIHTESKIRIECIRKIFGDPEDILNQFDFTIAKFAYWIEAEPDGDDDWLYEDRLLYHEQFFEHLLLKRLVVDDKMPYPASTFNRTYKYARSGFFPCRETKKKIMQALQSMDKPVGDSDLAKAMYEGHD